MKVVLELLILSILFQMLNEPFRCCQSAIFRLC